MSKPKRELSVSELRLAQRIASMSDQELVAFFYSRVESQGALGMLERPIGAIVSTKCIVVDPADAHSLGPHVSAFDDSRLRRFVHAELSKLQNLDEAARFKYLTSPQLPLLRFIRRQAKSILRRSKQGGYTIVRDKFPVARKRKR